MSENLKKTFLLFYNDIWEWFKILHLWVLKNIIIQTLIRSWRILQCTSESRCRTLSLLPNADLMLNVTPIYFLTSLLSHVACMLTWFRCETAKFKDANWQHLEYETSGMSIIYLRWGWYFLHKQFHFIQTLQICQAQARDEANKYSCTWENNYCNKET